MKLKRILFVCLLLTSVWAVGCFGPKPATSGSVHNSSLGKKAGIVVMGEFGPDGTLHGVDSGLKNRFSRERFKLTKIKGFNHNGINQVQLEVMNKKSKPAVVTYRFEWYDAFGRQLEVGSQPWLQIQLSGKEIKNITKASPTTDAVSFKILVREYKAS